MSFELKFFVCRHVSIRGFQNRVCLSVRTPRKKNHPSFVNISPTLVIDISMIRSSRVLQHGNPKSWFFFFKKSLKLTKLNFVCTPRVRAREKKSPWLRRYQSYISNWYINGKVFTGTKAWKHNFFFLKVRNWILTGILTCAEELKSP